MGELSHDVAAIIHTRAVDERCGVSGHDPPPEIGAELVVHGIADFFGDCHGGAYVLSVDVVLSFPDVFAVVQRVLVDEVSVAVEVSGDVGDMAGCGGVVEDGVAVGIVEI